MVAGRERAYLARQLAAQLLQLSFFNGI